MVRFLKNGSKRRNRGSNQISNKGSRLILGAKADLSGSRIGQNMPTEKMVRDLVKNMAKIFTFYRELHILDTRLNERRMARSRQR